MVLGGDEGDVKEITLLNRIMPLSLRRAEGTETLSSSARLILVEIMRERSEVCT